MPAKIPTFDKARIERMARAGYTISQVTAATGMSKQQVYYREEKTGVSFGRRENTPWTSVEDECLRLWRSEGFSASEIAQKLGTGRSRNSVIGRAERLGLCMPTNKGGRKTTVERKRVLTPAPASTPKAKPLLPQLPDNEVARLASIPDTVGVASLLDLEDHHCKYPVGEPRRGFCGDFRVGPLPYCQKHAIRCYRPTEPVSRGVAISAVSARLKVVA